MLSTVSGKNVTHAVRFYSGEHQLPIASCEGGIHTVPSNQYLHLLLGLHHAKHLNSRSGNSKGYMVNSYPYGHFSRVDQLEGFVWPPISFFHFTDTRYV